MRATQVLSTKYLVQGTRYVLDCRRSLDTLLDLVPRLCLGTQVRAALLRVRARKRSFRTCVPKRSLGTRHQRGATRFRGNEDRGHEPFAGPQRPVRLAVPVPGGAGLRHGGADPAVDRHDAADPLRCPRPRRGRAASPARGRDRTGRAAAANSRRLRSASSTIARKRGSPFSDSRSGSRSVSSTSLQPWFTARSSQRSASSRSPRAAATCANE